MAPLTNNRLDGIIVIVLILVILSGFIVAYYDSTQGTESNSLQLQEGETKLIDPPIQTTLESVDNAGINVTILDIKTTEINATTLSLGETDTLTLSGQNVSITYIIDSGQNSAVVSYEYPVSYSWGTIPTLWIGTIGLIVLGVFVYIILQTLNFREES